MNPLESIGAVVVTHNSEDVIGPCLDALSAVGSVVVIDNASQDGTVAEAEKRPWATVVANENNRGFAAAVNQGVARLSQPLILILNPDVTVRSGLEHLARTCVRCGAAAGLLKGADGKPQRGFAVRRLPTATTLVFESLGLNAVWPGNPVNRAYRYLDNDLTTECDVEQPAAAFFMVRRDIFESLGGFDESFRPVWFEDVDFAARLKLKVLSVRFVPLVTAIHQGGHSVTRLEPSCREVYWYGSLLKYAEKHFGRLQFRSVCGAVIAGCWIRAIAGILLARSWKPLANYNAVIRFAVSSLWSGRLVAPVAPEDHGGRERSVRAMTRTAQR